MLKGSTMLPSALTLLLHARFLHLCCYHMLQGTKLDEIDGGDLPKGIDLMPSFQKMDYLFFAPSISVVQIHLWRSLDLFLPVREIR